MLSAADAVVFYGCTPPPVEYYSWDWIISARLSEDYPFYPGTNFQDTLSFRDVNVSAVGDDASQFDQPALLVHTPDRNAAREIINAYTATASEGGAGVPPESVNVQPIDSSTVGFVDRSIGWKASGPDLIAMIQRVTMAQQGSKSSFEAFLNMTFPVRVYLAADDATATEPMAPTPRPRETEGESGPAGLPTEKELLSNALGDLAQAVEIAFKSPNEVALTSYGFGNYSGVFDSYDDWEQCLAAKNNKTWELATRDATYAQGSNITAASVLRESSVAVMIGVLHTGTSGLTSNPAVFFEAGVDIVNLAHLILTPGPFVLSTSVTESTWLSHWELEGSAARYLPDYDPSLTAFLFAVDFVPESIGCGAGSPFAGPWCTTISSTALNPKHFPGSPPPFMVAQPGERVYSVPLTRTGPSKHEALPTRLLSFDLAGPCALQFESIICRADGTIGQSVPCDASCGDSCQVSIWADAPMGADLDLLLQCTKNPDGSVTKFACDGDTLILYTYADGACESCELAYELPAAGGGYCFFAGTIPGCVPDDMNATVRPCSGGGRLRTENVGVKSMPVALMGSSIVAEEAKSFHRRLQVDTGLSGH
jgi:hypothetical protein